MSVCMRKREEGSLRQSHADIPDIDNSQSLLRRFLDFLVVIIIHNSFAGAPLRKEEGRQISITSHEKSGCLYLF